MEHYKGFVIQPDRLLGFSLIDRKGMWACSAVNIDKLKKTVDDILNLEHQ